MANGQEEPHHQQRKESEVQAQEETRGGKEKRPRRWKGTKTSAHAGYDTDSPAADRHTGDGYTEETIGRLKKPDKLRPRNGEDSITTEKTKAHGEAIRDQAAKQARHPLKGPNLTMIRQPPQHAEKSS